MEDDLDDDDAGDDEGGDDGDDLIDRCTTESLSLS